MAQIISEKKVLSAHFHGPRQHFYIFYPIIPISSGTITFASVHASMSSTVYPGASSFSTNPSGLTWK